MNGSEMIEHQQGRSQDLVSGGGTHFGGPDPLFFASDPKSQGSPLCTFGYLRISGGRPPLATPLAPERREISIGEWVEYSAARECRGRVEAGRFP